MMSTGVTIQNWSMVVEIETVYKKGLKILLVIRKRVRACAVSRRRMMSICSTSTLWTDTGRTTLTLNHSGKWNALTIQKHT